MVCPVCGPLCSRYYMVISLWGIVMLGLLGVFFWFRSPALFEDLPIKAWKENNFTREYAQEKYEQTAMNCWIAAGVYVVLFLFSFAQMQMNKRATYEMS